MQANENIPIDIFRDDQNLVSTCVHRQSFTLIDTSTYAKQWQDRDRVIIDALRNRRTKHLKYRSFDYLSRLKWVVNALPEKSYIHPVLFSILMSARISWSSLSSLHLLSILEHLTVFILSCMNHIVLVVLHHWTMTMAIMTNCSISIRKLSRCQNHS